MQCAEFPPGTRVKPPTFYLPSFLALCSDREEFTTALSMKGKLRSRVLNVHIKVNSSSCRCSDPFRVYWVASESPLLAVVAMSVCTMYIS